MTARVKAYKGRIAGRKPALYRFTFPDGRPGEMKTFAIDREDNVVALVYPKDKRWYVADVDPAEAIRAAFVRAEYTQVPAVLLDKGKLTPCP